ncbi:MAG: N-glycosylase/DNA lyase [Puniceicoccaceae bacterium 5H]|nr:MAG: N-glycosylase/DNA lyase [Puniceicoccaceae bacterium 5H]
MADWQPLPNAPRLSPAVWAETLDGGQAFRWNWQADAQAYLGIWRQHVVQLRLAPDEALHWRALTPHTTAADVADYLALDVDFAALTDALPWRSDPVLAAAITRWPGLRLLRQPLEEALLGFLCSATKRIPQIKLGLEALAEGFGQALAGGYHALPTWEELARATEAELRATGIGYRAKNLHQTAHFLRAHPGYLEALADLAYPAAHQHLLALPGVGPKVADCVLLFGAQRYEAFPVDTWILQTMGRHYALEGWKPEQIAHFGRVHYGSAAGLAQQYLFAGARRGKNAE